MPVFASVPVSVLRFMISPDSGATSLVPYGTSISIPLCLPPLEPNGFFLFIKSLLPAGNIIVGVPAGVTGAGAGGADVLTHESVAGS